MVYKILIYGTRKQGLTPEQFRDHYENKHVPLIRSLAGDNFPISHQRHYIGRSSDGQPAVIPPMGEPSDFTWDVITILTFRDQKHFEEGMGGVLGDPEKAKKIAEDEAQFTDRSSIKAVVLGEVTETRNDKAQ